MIEAALLTILLGDSTLSNIVDERIYLNVIPQYSEDDTTTNSPAIVIIRQATNFEETECAGEEPTVDLTLILIADSFTQLASMAQASIDLLRTYSATNGTTQVTAGDIVYLIDDLQINNYRTEWLAEIDGDSKGLFRGLIETTIRYET